MISLHHTLLIQITHAESCRADIGEFLAMELRKKAELELRQQEDNIKNQKHADQLRANQAVGVINWIWYLIVTTRAGDRWFRESGTRTQK